MRVSCIKIVLNSSILLRVETIIALTTGFSQWIGEEKKGS